MGLNVDGNPAVEKRLKDLEDRMTAQALALYTLIWTISRIDPDAANRIMTSLDRMSDHLRSENPHATAHAEISKLQLALRRAFEAQGLRQG